MSRSPFVKTLLEVGNKFDVEPGNYRLESLVMYIVSIPLFVAGGLLLFWREGCMKQKLNQEQIETLEKKLRSDPHLHQLELRRRRLHEERRELEHK